MNNTFKILAIDPSGNFTEGKGTTGWSLLNFDGKIIACGQILASSFNTKMYYWNAIVNQITILNPSFVVVEDFLLYASKATNQINSRFETSKLIGILEFMCDHNKIPIYLQRALDVKKRWTDQILVAENIIEKIGSHYYAGGVLTSEHIRDSIRHGTHFIRYKLPKILIERKLI